MTDRKADVIQAAYLASEIAHRMVVPGGEVWTDIESIAQQYHRYSLPFPSNDSLICLLSLSLSFSLLLLLLSLFHPLPLSLPISPSSFFHLSQQNMAVTDAIQKVCRSFECNACEGILSYQLKRNNYNTEKTIILNPNEQQR